MKGNWQQPPTTGPTSLVRHPQSGSGVVEAARSNVKSSDDLMADEVVLTEPSLMGLSVKTRVLDPGEEVVVLIPNADSRLQKS